jgi:hypothetical protein
LAGVPPWAQGYGENRAGPGAPNLRLQRSGTDMRGGILAPPAIHPVAIMLRSPFPGHRRYSITHRAVQRLRELVPTLAEEDDEALRDRLDAALIAAEDGGKAVRTLDVMLAEPQILIPLESFGDTLYAIIKEDTVVTVLPRGHGEEILQRGQALEQRVAAGDPPPRPGERDEAWELSRRRWRRDVPTPVVERVRSPGSERGEEPTIEEPTPSPQIALALAGEESVEEPARPRARAGNRLIAPPVADRAAVARKPAGPVAEALARGLALARRRAAARALGETLRQQPADAPLLPLWNLLTEKNLPAALTIGDLLTAVRDLPGA